MKTQEAHILAWHYLPALGQLSHNDKRPVIVGKTLHHKGPVLLCESGLHASVRLVDALSHCCGRFLCRVECWGDVQTHSDKIAVRHRRCLAMADVTPQLRLFAVLCAEHVLPIFEAKFPGDRRPRAAVDTAKRYLEGTASRDALITAANEAWNARRASAAASASASAASAYAASAAAASAAAAYAVAAADVASAASASASAAAAYAAVAVAAYAAAYAAARRQQAADAARAEAREWQERTLISLLPDAFSAWKGATSDHAAR